MTKSLMLILILAAVTRLSFLGLIEYKADEALTVLSLQEWIEHPHIIESGLISSTGVKNFPLFSYLLLLPAVISTDPRFLSGVIGLVNVVMVGWFYVATKRAFGKRAALIAGLILAVAPYPVLFSRKIWAQDLLMLFAVPIYDLLLQKKTHYFWLGLLLTLQAQLHGSGLFFMMAVVVWLQTQKKLGWRMVAGGAVGLVPTLPYFISRSFSWPLSNYVIDWQHLLLAAKLLGTFSWTEVMGAADFDRLAGSSPAVGLGILVSIMVIVGLGVGMWSNKKIAGLIGGLVLVYLIFGVPARLHYYQVAAPYVVVLTALGLVKVFKNQELFLWPSMGIMVISNMLFWGMFLRHVVVHQGVNGDFGIPYLFTVKNVDMVVAEYGQRTDARVIRAWAHFDPVLSKNTNGAMQHYNLAQYFTLKGEKDLAQEELDRAIELDVRFGAVTIGQEEDQTNQTTDNNSLD